MPDGLSTTTRCASSNTMRKPAGVGSGRGAARSSDTRWPARTRRAGSSARSSSTNTLPVVHSLRTCAQLSPCSCRRRAAATVAPSSGAPIMNETPRSATNEIEDAGESGVEVLRLRAAPLRHVGAAAALAPDRLRHLADDLAGIELGDEIRRHHRHERDLVALDAGEDDHARAHLVALLVGDLAQRLGVGHVDARGEHAHAADVARFAANVAAAARRQFAAKLFDLLFLLALLGLQLRDARGDLEAAGLEQPAALAELALQAADEAERARAGHRLEAPDALGDAALLGDQEEGDVAGARDVRAAAELLRFAHRHDADAVAVLLPEERDGAGLLRLGDRQHRGVGGGVLAHALVHQIFHALPL